MVKTKVLGSIPGRVTGDFSEASDKSMCLGSTQPLKMVRRGDDLTTFMCRVSRNLGALTSWTLLGHVGL